MMASNSIDLGLDTFWQCAVMKWFEMMTLSGGVTYLLRELSLVMKEPPASFFFFFLLVA
jgi:hypothetical protein